jgi:hypothetical protein
MAGFGAKASSAQAAGEVRYSSLYGHSLLQIDQDDQGCVRGKLHGVSTVRAS